MSKYRSSQDVERALNRLDYIFAEEFESEQGRSLPSNNGFMLRTLLVLYVEEPKLFYALGVFGVTTAAPQSYLDLAVVAMRIRRFTLNGGVVLHGVEGEGTIGCVSSFQGEAIVFRDVFVRDLSIFLRDLEKSVQIDREKKRKSQLEISLYTTLVDGQLYFPSPLDRVFKKRKKGNAQ